MYTRKYGVPNRWQVVPFKIPKLMARTVFGRCPWPECILPSPLVQSNLMQNSRNCNKRQRSCRVYSTLRIMLWETHFPHPPSHNTFSYMLACVRSAFSGKFTDFNSAHVLQISKVLNYSQLKNVIAGIYKSTQPSTQSMFCLWPFFF